MKDKILIVKAKPKKHIKMYCSDKVFNLIASQCEEDEVSQSAFLLSAVKAKLKECK